MNKDTEIARKALKMPVHVRINKRHAEFLIDACLNAAKDAGREEAAEEIARLRAENESLARNLRGKHALTGATYAHLVSERDALKQQNAALAAILSAPVERGRCGGLECVWWGGGSFLAGFCDARSADVMAGTLRERLGAMHIPDARAHNAQTLKRDTKAIQNGAQNDTFSRKETLSTPP